MKVLAADGKEMQAGDETSQAVAQIASNEPDGDYGDLTFVGC